MSGLKTLLLALIVLPVQGLAMEISLVSSFASCAGRLSAELEHAWLMQDERSFEFERQRRQFIKLLDATALPEQRRHVLSLRIDAKVAHAALLSQATFSQDREQGRIAVRRANSEIAYCSGYLLES